MRKRQLLLTFTSLVVFSCTLLLVGLLVLPTSVIAKQAPPPPSKPPLEPPTEEPTEEPTDEPTEEPTDEPTEEPTDEPTEEPTGEPTEEPTDEPTEEPTAEPTEEPAEEPGKQPVDRPSAKPKPPEDSEAPAHCQSALEGDVTDAAGRRVTGATVSITGDGVDRKILSDDNGHYGFGGLCSGTVSVSAAQPGGQMSPFVNLDLDGKSTFYLNLSMGAVAQESPAQPEATELAAQQTPTPEPSMPQTGFSGGLLLSGVALAALLLLLLAGARRWLSTS
jgi:cytoskeletal protein RodZ